MDPVNVPAKFEVRSFTRSGDNRRYLKTLGNPCHSLDMPVHSLFSKILNGLLLGWTLWMLTYIFTW